MQAPLGQLDDLAAADRDTEPSSPGRAQVKAQVSGAAPTGEYVTIIRMPFLGHGELGNSVCSACSQGGEEPPPKPTSPPPVGSVRAGWAEERARRIGSPAQGLSASVLSCRCRIPPTEVRQGDIHMWLLLAEPC